MEEFVQKYVNPFTDFGFKKLFGEEPNKDLLLDFLNELLKEQEGNIIDLTYLKTEQLGNTSVDRKAIFDLYCTNEKGDNLDKAELFCTYGEEADETIKVTAKDNPQNKAGSWYLLNLLIDTQNIPAGKTLRIACKNNNSEAIYIDDFRFQPANAGVTSYAYDQQLGRLTHILDGDNLYQRYVYGIHGRLKETYQEIFYPVEKRVSRQEYYYNRLNND